MNRLLKIIGILGAVSLFIASSLAFAQTDPIKSRQLKFAMSVGVQSPWTQAAQRFARQVGEESGGKIKVTVYPDGQLSNGNQITEFELLKNGTIDFTFHSSIILSILDPRFALFSLPWIAPTEEGLFRVIDGPGQAVWDGLEKVGVHPLGGYSTSGYRQLTNSKHPITRPEDMSGMTFRVPGLKLYLGVFKELKANPVPTSFGELYGALQQGVVDGQENPISLIYATKFHEVQKYMTIWNYSADAIGILINKKLWDSLSAREQAIMVAAAKDAAAWHRTAQSEADVKALAAMGSNLAVTKLSPAQIAVFRKAVQPVYDQFEGTIGKSLIEAAQAVQ